MVKFMEGLSMMCLVLAYKFKLLFSRNAKVPCLEDNHGPHNGDESTAAHAALGIGRFPHPANSPDLNPIEIL
jgi:hypothetical protein